MNEMRCKLCGSLDVIKYGTFRGVQRYWCKACERKFADNDALPTMRTPKRVVASALSCYFGGMPLDAIQRHLNQQFGLYLSEAGIYKWIIRFSQDAVRKAKRFKPKVGDIWVADETCIKVGGRNVWFWDIIDVNSRFLLASHISESRTTKDAQRLVEKASRMARKTPKVVVTDYLQAYIDGIELAFGADTEHLQSKPFKLQNHNNLIERFHGTLKDRTNVLRGFKSIATARLLTDAWLVHYNFFKEHEALGNVPPAIKMGVDVPFTDWAEVMAGKVGIEQPYAPPNLKPTRRRISKRVKKHRKTAYQMGVKGVRR